ncbi:unnamed protein product [Rotaria sp. Silwood2]|nr:unnamed protein product [Rotaria sp. Silwood2]
MACLVHNTRYRSLFHTVVNELRNENRTPACKLRNMPRQCCTCDNPDNQTLISVLIDDKDKLMNLKNLTDQIDRDKNNNSKLVLSLNRLENFIKENRMSHLNLLSTSTVDDDMNKSDDDSTVFEENQRMNTGKSKSRKETKSRRPLKNGTFLFLPYKFVDKPKLESLLEAAKTLQRGRFIGRNGYISSLGKQHKVCIIMVTPETSEQVKRTLQNAKAGIGKVKIHNQKNLLDIEDGEWILVRQKQMKYQADPIDFDALLDKLKKRWERFLKIQKRKTVDKEYHEDEEYPNKK